MKPFRNLLKDLLWFVAFGSSLYCESDMLATVVFIFFGFYNYFDGFSKGIKWTVNPKQQQS